MDDTIKCPMCIHIISTEGKLADGSTEPYAGRSLITHFKKVHGTNSLGIDKELGLVPGTTKNCSDSLRQSFSTSGKKGSEKSKEISKLNRREIEDSIASDDMFS